MLGNKPLKRVGTRNLEKTVLASEFDIRQQHQIYVPTLSSPLVAPVYETGASVVLPTQNLRSRRDSFLTAVR
jgi:hypothetical protein